VTFEEFVKPALLKMQGKKNLQRPIQGVLTTPFRNGSRFHFVRAQCARKNGRYTVRPLKGQGSHMIGELASANAILPVAPHAVLRRNQVVSVKILGMAS